MSGTEPTLVSNTNAGTTTNASNTQTSQTTTSVSTPTTEELVSIQNDITEAGEVYIETEDGATVTVPATEVSVVIPGTSETETSVTEAKTSATNSGKGSSVPPEKTSVHTTETDDSITTRKIPIYINTERLSGNVLNFGNGVSVNENTKSFLNFVHQSK